MLNKDICKKCINIHPTHGGYKGWTGVDLALWQQTQIVSCPRSLIHLKRGEEWKHPSIHEDPPYYCPYKVEHVVSQ